MLPTILLLSFVYAAFSQKLVIIEEFNIAALPCSVQNLSYELQLVWINGTRAVCSCGEFDTSPRCVCGKAPTIVLADIISGQSILTIVNTSIYDTGTWRCIVSMELRDREIYNMIVVGRPTTFKCETNFTENSMAISISCLTEHIFPSGVCIFYMNNTVLEQSQIEYNHTKNSQGYFISMCDISIPLSSVTLGMLNVTAQIFPNGTNSSYGLSLYNYIPIEPPDLPPVILINQHPTTNMTVTIQEGDNITLTCRVVGGNPNSGNISLTCGFTTSASEGNIVHLVLGKVFRERNGQICICFVQFVIGSYEQNAAYVILNVLYKAMVTGFSIIGTNITTIKVKNESIVTFQCEADGNPKPVITIENQRKVYATDSGMLSTLMACEDGGDYFCKATNGFPSDQEPQYKYNTTVYVICPPQLNTKAAQLDVYYEVKGNNFSKHLLIFGYPAPQTFVVYKLNATTNLNAVTKLNKDGDSNIVSSEGNRISLSFSYQDIPYGDLHIAINSLIATDFTSYKLYISNNVTSNQLEYSFEIKEMEQHSNDVVAASLGGTLAAVVLIAVCILAIVQRRNILSKIQTTVFSQNKTKDNDIYVNSSSETTTENTFRQSGYEDVNTLTTYDRLEQLSTEPDAGSSYATVNSIVLYDHIDTSQVKIEPKYERFVMDQTGSYQNLG